MIIEFSLDYESDSRLFYGLKKNGRYYFGSSVFKEIKETSCLNDADACGYKGRNASTNLFVYFYSDTNKSKQYLFIMSSGDSLVELIDIENNLEYFAWSSTNFFNLDKPIFSYKFPLFEIDNSNTYITVFSESGGYRDDLEIANDVTLQKFRIDSIGSNIQKQILNSIKIDKCFSNRGVSAFRLEKRQIIIVMALINEVYNPYANNDREKNDNNNCSFYFYNDNLEYLGRRFLFHNVEYIWEGWGLFLKGLLVKDDYFAVAYFYQSYGKSLTFNIRQYKGVDIEDDILINYNDFGIEFKSDVLSNELYKLDDNRLIFLTSYGENDR